MEKGELIGSSSCCVLMDPGPFRTPLIHDHNGAASKVFSCHGPGLIIIYSSNHYKSILILSTSDVGLIEGVIISLDQKLDTLVKV